MAGQLHTRTLGQCHHGGFLEAGRSRPTCWKDPKFTLIFTSSSPCLHVRQAQSPIPGLFSPTPELFSPTPELFSPTPELFSTPAHLPPPRSG